MKSNFIPCEVARILVPGFYFALVFFAYVKIFLLGHQPIVLTIGTQMVLFVACAIIAGFTMYAQETPKRRKAFQKNQPSLYLKTFSQLDPSLPALTDDDARLLYFYILNNHIPDRFHEKIFFFGTISTIIIQVRRISLWFSFFAFITFLASVASYGFFAPSVLQVFYFLLMSGIYILTVRYNKAERKIQENYHDQIFWLQMNKELVLDLLRRFPVEKGTSHEN